MSRFARVDQGAFAPVPGASYGTIMRNDAFRFIRLGTFIERADNTLRLLDARYEMAGIRPKRSAMAPPTRIKWSALLRALSSFEAYTEIYRDAPGARHVAELLLLRADVPRSLRACTEEIDQILPSCREPTAVPRNAWRRKWTRDCATPASTKSSTKACTPGSPSSSRWCASWVTRFTVLIWRRHETFH
jgi:uncharacterized alpha-E superfamily protein